MSRVDTDSLGRVVRSVTTHNRVLQCNEMWRQHRKQDGDEQSELKEQQQQQIGNHTPASLLEARRAAAARKVVAKSESSLQSQEGASSYECGSGSDSDSSSDSRDRKRRRKERDRKRDKHEKRSRHEKREKHEKRERKKRKKHHEKKKQKKHDREYGEARPSPPRAEVASAECSAALPLSVVGAAFAEDETSTAAGSTVQRRIVGAQRPEDAAAEAERGQRIATCWDASLGVYRSVRENGEVVEQCVSRQEQLRMQHVKARVVPRGPLPQPAPGDSLAEGYTGKDKFPSQHPWFGYK